MSEQITNYTESLWAGVAAAFTSFMNFMPSLLGAIIILLGGWIISKLIGSVIVRVLKAAKLESIVEKAHISDYLPQSEKGVKPRLTMFVGTMAKWFIFLIFIQAAVITLGVAQLTGIINSIILFIPNVVVAVIILVAGAWAARFVSALVEVSTAKINGTGTNILASLSRYGILGFALIAAVGQLGIATNLINILFTGLVAFLAISFGLAFGLGGQGVASDITRSWADKVRSRMTDSPVSPEVKDDQLSQ